MSRESSDMGEASGARTQGREVPYPLFVYLAGMRVVCVGGGACAERKVEGLVGHGADVTVVAPSVTARLRELADAGSVLLVCRPYRRGDLEGAILVIGATDDPVVNHRVYLDASRAGQLVNVVDDPPNCNAIMPSVLRRGSLQVAVSTGGAAPGIARDVRRSLEAEFPSWYGEYVLLVDGVRQLIRERVPGPAARRAELCEAVYACGLEGRFADGERPRAEEVFSSVVEPLLARMDGRSRS